MTDPEMQDVKVARRPRKRTHSLYCLVVSAGPFVIVRMPEHCVRWPKLRKEIHAMMRSEHGVKAKDVLMVEGLAGDPYDEADTKEDIGLFERAFAGDPDALKKLNLHAWNEDMQSFDRIRKGEPEL